MNTGSFKSALASILLGWEVVHSVRSPRAHQSHFEDLSPESPFLDDDVTRTYDRKDQAIARVQIPRYGPPFRAYSRRLVGCHPLSLKFQSAALPE